MHDFKKRSTGTTESRTNAPHDFVNIVQPCISQEQNAALTNEVTVKEI